MIKVDKLENFFVKSMNRGGQNFFNFSCEGVKHFSVSLRGGLRSFVMSF